jgi:hypothetical protein
MKEPVLATGNILNGDELILPMKRIDVSGSSIDAVGLRREATRRIGAAGREADQTAPPLHLANDQIPNPTVFRYVIE